MRIASTIILALCLAGPVSAQSDERYTARSWNVEHDLPQSSVRCITQSHDGYLWIGTWNGLARFDGIRMKVFNGLNTPNLNPSIVDIFEDSKHRLWIGTDGGGLMQYRNGAFVRMDTIFGGGVITYSSIAEDPSGRIWFAYDRGISVYRDDTFLHFNSSHGLPDASATYVFRAPDGSMYIQYVGRIYHVRLSGDSLVHIDPPFHTGGYRIALDSSGTIWYGIKGRGLVRRTGSKESLDTRLASHHPKEIFVTPDQTVWIMTPRGAFILKDGNLEHRQYIGGVDISNISSVFQDREGILWLAAEGGGLTRLLPKQVQTITTKEGLETSSIMCGFEDRSGTMWIGTWLGGLAQSNGRSHDAFTLIPQLSNGLTIMAVCQSFDGTMWVGTWAHGVHTIRQGRVERFLTKGLHESTTVRSIVSDTGQGVWIAAIYSSVWHVGPEGVQVWDTTNGLSSSMINSMLRTRNGDVWIGTDGGGVATISQGRVSTLDSRSGLLSDFMHVNIEDSEGSIWLSSKLGLQRWKDGRLSTITAQQGFDDDPAQFLQDDDGHYWVGGTHGIHRISFQEMNGVANGTLSHLSYLSIGKADGMPIQEVAGGSNQHAWKTRSGALWFGTTQGAVWIDPRKVSSNPVRPGVLIEEVLVEHRPVSLSEEIALLPQETKIEFRYTGINFSSPENIRFRYVLEGFDGAWRDVGKERYAQYTNLAPGTYTFRVTAANNAGIWNEDGVSVVVHVLPPFWATWWFRGLAVFLFLSVGPFIYWVRVTGLKRQQARHQEFSRKLIEQQEAERKRIAGELHDGLGQQLLVIKNRLLMSMQETPPVDGKEQSLAQISEVVGSAIEEVRSISHNLRPHQLDQLGLTKTLRAVVRQLRESTQLIVTAHLDDIDGVLGGDEEISLFRIVQEALSNVSKHSGASEVTVTTRRETGKILVEVTDNGRGFDLNHGSNQERFGTSFGLSGMAERARMFGWEFTMDSAKGQGTTIRVRVSTEAWKREHGKG